MQNMFTKSKHRFAIPQHHAEDGDEAAASGASRPVRGRLMRLVTAGLCAAVLGACAAPQASGINDPFESANRQVHAFNVAADRVLFYRQPPMPEPIARPVENFAANLSLPSKVVNSVLQGRIAPALQNSFRFALNTTLGVGGIFDPAGSSFGLPEVDTDFGETLHVWGVPEGPFIEVPFRGPSTLRDVTGIVVDFFTDPVDLVITDAGDRNLTRGVWVTSRVSERLRYGDAVDAILHESADSYAQARILYLQNRRYTLSRGTGDTTAADADAFDPYEDLYAE